jgi:hypothetical protein
VLDHKERRLRNRRLAELLRRFFQTVRAGIKTSRKSSLRH